MRTGEAAGIGIEDASYILTEFRNLQETQLGCPVADPAKRRSVTVAGSGTWRVQPRGVLEYFLPPLVIAS